MRRFVFTGDPRAPGQDPGACSVRGHEFTLNGPPIAVADDVADRLAAHSHFVEVFGADEPAPAMRRKRRG